MNWIRLGSAFALTLTLSVQAPGAQTDNIIPDDWSAWEVIREPESPACFYYRLPATAASPDVEVDPASVWLVVSAVSGVSIEAPEALFPASSVFMQVNRRRIPLRRAADAKLLRMPTRTAVTVLARPVSFRVTNGRSHIAFEDADLGQIETRMLQECDSGREEYCQCENLE
ncbi:MAG: hypothetical protein AAGH68_11555 [Pseudomonadota bacterium]